jgi:hypothetical protein
MMKAKNIMSVVFAQGNKYTYLSIINTQLPASTTTDTDHITSTAHSTHYEVIGMKNLL